MQLKKYFISGLFLLLGFTLLGHSQVLAFDPMDTLSPIKSHLQKESIRVLDFSLPENQWGNLTPEWIGVIQSANNPPDSLRELIEQKKLNTFFEGPESLNELRYQKSVLEAQKTQVGTQAERQEKEDEITLLNEAIEKKEREVSLELVSYVLDLDDPDRRLEGINLLFKEVEFYFNIHHWGNLPYPIVRALKKEAWADFNPLQLNAVAPLYLVLGEKTGWEALQQDLEGLNYTTAEGREVELSTLEMRMIFDAMWATQFEGERQINQMVQAIFRAIRNLLGGFAIFWIVISGIRMALGQGEESVITEQKKSILYALLGLIVLLLLDRLIAILYGSPGQIMETLRSNQQFSAEVYGVVSFIRAVIGIIAVAILVRSGIKAIASQGQEDEITKQRQSLAWVIAGLIVIAINKVIVENIFIAPVSQDGQIYSSNIATIIGVFGTVTKFLLGFVGLIALGILVYGAGMMITNYGDEEQVTKAKTLIKNAIIGILVIIAAYTLVATLVTFG